MVLSTFGAQFAPDQEQTARELFTSAGLAGRLVWLI